MQNSRLWAQYDGVALGCVYAVVILVMALFDAAEPVQLIPRIYFGFAIGVLSKRMIDTATIVLAETGTAGRVRVLMGIAQGTAWGMAMILAFWPLETAQVVIWACAGLVFGALMGGLAKPVPVPEARRALYTMQDMPLGASWVFFGPMLFVVVLALTWSSHQEAVNPVPVMWLSQMVVFMTLHAAGNHASGLQKVPWIVVAIGALAVGYWAR